jgi:aquaporin Z
LRNKLIAEFVGTFLLVLLAVGSAVSGIVTNGTVGVAIGFGVVLAALAYALGPTSGCHVNPAVTLAFWLSKRQEGREAGLYVIMQFLGAALGGFALWLLVNSGGVTDETGGLGTNAFGGEGPNAFGAFLAEVLLTAAFVGVILLVTDHAAAPGFAGLAIGSALTAVHLVGIPLTGTSVNPARSLGPALFAGGESLQQVWLFLIAPLVGGAIAVLVWKITRPAEGVLGDEGQEALEREV